jgi:hypothetical protein
MSFDVGAVEGICQSGIKTKILHELHKVARTCHRVNTHAKSSLHMILEWRNTCCLSCTNMVHCGTWVSVAVRWILLVWIRIQQYHTPSLFYFDHDNAWGSREPRTCIVGSPGWPNFNSFNSDLSEGDGQVSTTLGPASTLRISCSSMSTLSLGGNSWFSALLLKLAFTTEEFSLIDFVTTSS